MCVFSLHDGKISPESMRNFEKSLFTLIYQYIMSILNLTRQVTVHQLFSIRKLSSHCDSEAPTYGSHMPTRRLLTAPGESKVWWDLSQVICQ